LKPWRPQAIPFLSLASFGQEEGADMERIANFNTPFYPPTNQLGSAPLLNTFQYGADFLTQLVV
jgi:hypothetical protein